MATTLLLGSTLALLGRSCFVCDDVTLEHRSALPVTAEAGASFTKSYQLSTVKMRLVAGESQQTIHQALLPGGTGWHLRREAISVGMVPQNYPTLSPAVGIPDATVYGTDWLGVAKINLPADNLFQGQKPYALYVVIVPLPSIALLSGILPALWLRGHLRRRRLARRG